MRRAQAVAQVATMQGVLTTSREVCHKTLRNLHLWAEGFDGGRLMCSTCTTSLFVVAALAACFTSISAMDWGGGGGRGTSGHGACIIPCIMDTCIDLDTGLDKVMGLLLRMLAWTSILESVMPVILLDTPRRCFAQCQLRKSSMIMKGGEHLKLRKKIICMHFERVSRCSSRVSLRVRVQVFWGLGAC